MKKKYRNIHALYNDEKIFLKSTEIIKKKNIFIHDIYTPYPIHGIEKFLNFKETNLSLLSFFYGLLGICVSMILIWYTMIFDWPQNIGGKPYFSWIKNLPSFIPVIFEILIFFSAHFMCITYLIQCNLFPGRKSKNPDYRTTDHMFLIEIHSFKEHNKTIDFLKKNGAIETKLLK